MSEEPKEKEATWLDVVKAVGELALVVVGRALEIFMSGDGPYPDPEEARKREEACKAAEEQERKRWNNMTNRQKIDELRRENQSLREENTSLRDRVDDLDQQVESAKSEAERKSGVKVTVVRL